MGLAVTSLAAMFATSQLLAESVDRPAPRPLQPLVPDLGSMGTIQVEPPGASRAGRPPAAGRPPVGDTPPRRQPAERPPQPAGGGTIVVVVHQHPVRTVVQKVVEVIRVPAASPSRHRQPRRRFGHDQLSSRRWLRLPHRGRPDDPARREEEHPPCPDGSATDDPREGDGGEGKDGGEGHDGQDGRDDRNGRDHDEWRRDHEERSDRQRQPHDLGDPEPAAPGEDAQAPVDEHDPDRDRRDGVGGES